MSLEEATLSLDFMDRSVRAGKPFFLWHKTTRMLAASLAWRGMAWTGARGLRDDCPKPFLVYLCCRLM